MIKGFSFKNLSQAINKYDNILVAGDLNIDVSGSKGLNDNHFSEMIDTFNLTNLVKTPTCFIWMCYSQISQILYKKLTFLYSHLKRRKQSVNDKVINDTESFLEILLSGVPHRSILAVFSLIFL